MGRDTTTATMTINGRISIHSPRMGRDQMVVELKHGLGIISIHSPRMGRDWTKTAAAY